MSRLIGYDPLRIVVLRRRTDEAVESLRRVGCADPAGADESATVARTIGTLTELWIPLLDRIAASTAMTAWEAHGPGGRRWETFAIPDEHLLANLREMDAEEFLDFLDAQSRRWQPVGGPGPDLDDEHVQSALAAIGTAIDERFEADPGIGTALGRAAASAPVIALALRYSGHRSELIIDVAGGMLDTDPATADFHPQTFRPGLQQLLVEIATDPVASLELLQHDGALAGLASRRDLEPDLVRTITRQGLHDVVHDDTSRLADGYEVLRELTVLANGKLDGGFAPGMAQGVGDAFIGYVDTLAPAISYVSERVLVPEAGDGFELGSYDDLVDLLGAVAIDPIGQAGLGTAVGAHLDASFGRIEEDLASGSLAASRLTASARMARAVDEAIVAEDAEAQAAAAAEAARQRQLGAGVGFVVGMGGLAVGGPTGVLVSVAEEVAGLIPAASKQQSPQIVDHDLSGTFVREATFGMLALLVRDPRARGNHQLGRVSGEEWERLEARVAEVEARPASEREAAIVALDRDVRHTVPALDAAVSAEIDLAGVDDVRRGGGKGDAPD